MPFKMVPPLYSVWASMRDRCFNPNFRQYADYGGRGISVCERWNDYKTFEADMSPRPSPLHTLDRIDNDKGYSPENCRWATRKEQQRNQRRAVLVTIEGRQYRAIELAELAGLKTDTIVARAKAGLPFDLVIDPNRRTSTLIGVIGPKARKAKAAAKTHCSKGHALTEQNTYVTKEGWRICRSCHNAKMRRRNEARRAASGQNPPPVSY